MKLRISNFKFPTARDSSAGFTLIEIAICLAIIGFALVAIIGVLPIGMNTQRDNREETIINQDATVLLESIRSAARGEDDLTNFVYAITNSWQGFDDKGQPTTGSGVYGYTYNFAYDNNHYLTNGANIVGLLGTPEFTDTNGLAISYTLGVNYYSNHIVAYIRSISGLAAEKPPQAPDSIMVQDSLTYRLLVVNAPMPVDTNTFNPTNQSSFATQLAGNQRELRLTFLWPQLPNGKLGNGRQTFRATIAGQLTPTNALYFYQPLSFTNAP